MDMNFGEVFAVIDGGSNFLCEPCAVEEKIELHSEHVPTWEVGSNGWLAPIACKKCKRSIPVICDGVESKPARPIEDDRAERDKLNISDAYEVAQYFLKTHTTWPVGTPTYSRRQWYALAERWDEPEARTKVVDALKALGIPATTYARMAPHLRVLMLSIMQDALVGENTGITP